MIKEGVEENIEDKLNKNQSPPHQHGGGVQK